MQASLVRTIVAATFMRKEVPNHSHGARTASDASPGPPKRRARRSSKNKRKFRVRALCRRYCTLVGPNRCHNPLHLQLPRLHPGNGRMQLCSTLALGLARVSRSLQPTIWAILPFLAAIVAHRLMQMSSRYLATHLDGPYCQSRLPFTAHGFVQAPQISCYPPFN